MRVAIGSSSFGAADPLPLSMLADAGVEYVLNPYGRRLSEYEVIAHLRGVDGLIAGLEPLTRTVFDDCPQLKAIARVGIGMDNVDLAAAMARGIIVSNTPDGPTEAVAEMTLAALLAIGRKLISSNEAMHNSQWEKSIGFGLNGITVAIVGYGRIGRRFADHLRYFGANILVVDPFLSPDLLPHGETQVDLPEALAKADVLSLHVSGSEELLNENAFHSMKPGMVLLNSSRGAVINEKALVAALDQGIVSDAWLDVFWEEPYQGPLTGYEQVLLTPHTSTYTRQCRLAMETEAVSNILRDLELL
jgi:D-3-phosphoglycerate dehydrogenase / 2-oxoglutarate reductase